MDFNRGEYCISQLEILMSTDSCFIIIIMTVKIIYILVSDRVWLRVTGNLGLYERNHDMP